MLHSFCSVNGYEMLSFQNHTIILYTSCVFHLCTLGSSLHVLKKHGFLTKVSHIENIGGLYFTFSLDNRGDLYFAFLLSVVIQ